MRKQTKAASRTRQAAEQGDAKAQHYLAYRYANGEGVDKDYAEAFKWQRKAAEQGHAEALYALAEMYARGEGVTRDAAEASKLRRKAVEQGTAHLQPLRKKAEAGDAAAQNKLSEMYFDSGMRGRAEQRQWWFMTAEQGHAIAQYHLGLMYAKGSAVLQKDAEAVKWYRKAAEQGHANAQNNRGDR